MPLNPDVPDAEQGEPWIPGHLRLYSKNNLNNKKNKPTALYLYRSTHFNQGNQIEDPEINPHTHGHWIDKETKTI